MVELQNFLNAPRIIWARSKNARESLEHSEYITKHQNTGIIIEKSRLEFRI